MAVPFDSGGRLLAVGDIHGYRERLVVLLARVAPTTADRLIFLGDYIDRGPESCQVIETLIGISQTFPATIFLRGNHEQMLLDCLGALQLLAVAQGSWPAAEETAVPMSGERPTPASLIALFLLNGGRSTLESYGGGFAAIPPAHRDFLARTRLWHRETGILTADGSKRDFLFVHAGVNPGRSLEEQQPEDLLWIRAPFLARRQPCGETIVVHGHTPTSAVPGEDDYRICVDSGVYRQGGEPGLGLLSCCDVRTRTIWQV